MGGVHVDYTNVFRGDGRTDGDISSRGKKYGKQCGGAGEGNGER